jgi:hypothetical protein
LGSARKLTCDASRGTSLLNKLADGALGAMIMNIMEVCPSSEIVIFCLDMFSVLCSHRKKIPAFVCGFGPPLLYNYGQTSPEIRKS